MCGHGVAPMLVTVSAIRTRGAAQVGLDPPGQQQLLAEHRDLADLGLRPQHAIVTAPRDHVVKEVMPFWIMSSLGIAASFFGSLLARHIVRTNHFPHPVNTLIVLGMNFLSFAIFWVLKLLVFNRIFHVPSELEEVEEHLEHEEEIELAHDGEGLSP